MFDFPGYGTVPWREFRKSVKTISVAKDITTIGNYAFHSLPATEIEFAADSKLESIGIYAFEYTSFDTIQLPEHVTRISAIAFGYMTGKLTISVPESVTHISDYAFSHTQIEMVVTEGSYAHNWAISKNIPYSFELVILDGPVGDYFYVDGARLNAYQLVEYEGNYYFINDGHKLAKNITLYLSDRFVEGKTFADGTAIPASLYSFDADGKMIINN